MHRTLYFVTFNMSASWDVCVMGVHKMTTLQNRKNKQERVCPNNQVNENMKYSIHKMLELSANISPTNRLYHKSHVLDTVAVDSTIDIAGRVRHLTAQLGPTRPNLNPSVHLAVVQALGYQVGSSIRLCVLRHVVSGDVSLGQKKAYNVQM